MSLFGQVGGNSSFGGSNQNQNQTQQNRPLFGSVNNNAQQQSGGLFGATGASQPQQAGGLFGSSSQTSQPQQSGGLFGSNPQQSQPGALTGGGINTSQPQQGGMFGGATNTSQQSGPAFGASTQQQGGGLFNQSNTQQTQPQQGGLNFAGLNQPNQQQVGGGQNKLGLSLFGNSSSNNTNQQQQQQPQQRSLFGATAPTSTNTQQQQQQRPFFQSTNSMSGGLTLGQVNSPPQQSVPGVKIDVSNLRGTTRFNDLHEELQKQIEQIDDLIQRQIQFRDQCDALMPGHGQNVGTVPGDVEFISNKVENVELAIENDSADVNERRGEVQRDAENSRISFRAVENLKLPQQLQWYGMYQGGSSITPQGNTRLSSDTDEDGTPNLVSFFSRQADDYSKQLDELRRGFAEVEDHLNSVEADVMARQQRLMFQRTPDGAARSADEQLKELENVFRMFANAIEGLAGRIGKVGEETQKVTSTATTAGAGRRRVGY